MKKLKEQSALFTTQSLEETKHIKNDRCNQTTDCCILRHMKKLKNRVLYPQVTKTHEARPDSKTLRHMKKHQNIFRNTHIKKKKKKSEILRHIKKS